MTMIWEKGNYTLNGDLGHEINKFFIQALDNIENKICKNISSVKICISCPKCNNTGEADVICKHVIITTAPSYNVLSCVNCGAKFGISLYSCQE